MSNELMTLDTLNFNLPAVPAELASKVAELTSEALEAAQPYNGVPTLTFSGREFHLKEGDTETVLNDRVLDVCLVYVAPRDHLVFYNSTFDDAKRTGVELESYTRWATKEDGKDSEWKPEGKWVSRTRKRRVILMIAGDTEYKLVMTDISSKSIYHDDQAKQGLYGLNPYLTMFNKSVKAKVPNALPFMFITQMSFTTDTVPVTQFSIVNQRSPQREVRATPADMVKKVYEYIGSGEVERLANLWIETDGEESAPVESTAVPQAELPPVAQPTPALQPAPVEPQPVTAPTEVSDW